MWEIFLGISLSFSKFPWWKSVKAENQWINGIAFQNWRGKNYVSEQQRIWGPSLQTYSANFCNNSCRILILSYSRFYNSDSELFFHRKPLRIQEGISVPTTVASLVLLNAFLLFLLGSKNDGHWLKLHRKSTAYWRSAEDTCTAACAV